LTSFIIAKLGFADVDAALSAGTLLPLRHLNIMVSLATPDVCWVTRRWAIPGVKVTANLTTPEPDEIARALHTDIENVLWGKPRELQPVMWLIANKVIASIIKGITDQAEHLWPIYPIIGHGGFHDVLKPTAELLARLVPAIDQELSAVGGWSSEALFLLLYRLLAESDDAIRSRLAPGILGRVTGIIGSNAFVNPARCASANSVLDVHGYYLDYNTAGDSCEYFFDAASDGYLAFADTVVSLANTRITFGYMGVRFTPNSSALIAMQRHQLTAAVEVATARARTDAVFAEFWAAVHDAARRNGGVAHWGQEFEMSAADVAVDYDDELNLWHHVLAEVSAEAPAAFSTAFTRELGLEPVDAGGIMLCDTLTAFERGLGRDMSDP